ncbi:Saccharopine dehydrogenase [Penicillium verrucosum]|uniref:Saccharopine dehydrogenase n=1 Tax=Penicillium verrucosum TaxID=60171 RepID=UPI002545BA19|nr:Saccharopine dehydrogenase [Penicillium verrucosum]KAJ5927670.1 Saccharopine dehydrogenase [Penicillium verrucosum]
MPEKKRILVLGSGMVAPPCIEYLTRNPHNEVTVACRTLSAAQALSSEFPRTQPLSLDVASAADLDTQVAAHDLVISLIPYTQHAAVIKSAIKGRTNVVTTSYVSAEMRALDDAVKKAGITVLNEVGVDPGVDHLYAIKTINEVHEKGGKVKEFYSYCGGLPAPECANNPLGFKFSWSPRGAILSQRNSASFLRHGKQVDIPATELMSVAKPYYVMDGYSFVAYPNRNSVPFREFYNIPEAETVIRGSLRYQGNPEFIQALASIGWLDQEEKSWLKPEITWAQIQQRLVNSPGSDERSLIARINEVYKFPTEAESERIISGLRWLGLFSTEPAMIKDGNIFDTLCHQLAKLLGFKSGERDVVMLQHKFIVEWRDGKKDTITSTLELLGDPERYSAMALSVGVTCGVATQLLLDGHPALHMPGILAPYSKEICDPIREAVAREGVKLVEKVI